MNVYCISLCFCFCMSLIKMCGMITLLAPQVKVQQDLISTLPCVSMSPSVTGAECRLDVPVTKQSVLSDSQIHHIETGANLYKYAN